MGPDEFFVCSGDGETLQRLGVTTADVLVYVGDHVPNIPGRKHAAPAGILPGYDFDWCNEEVLLTRITAKDGRLVLPDGVSYRALVLPDHGVLSLPVARKLREFVRAGVAITGPRPKRTASLSGFPASEAELETIAAELWRDGGIIARATAAELLEKRGLAADVNWTTGNLDWIHRRDGEADIYFVANLAAEPVKTTLSFRIAGRQPELWDPLTGSRRDAAAFAQTAGRTTLPLELPAYGSHFVVFRRAIADDTRGPATANEQVLAPVAALAGPWTLAFDPALRGPTEVRFETLSDWTTHADPAIRDYSGTATYRLAFDRPSGAGPWTLELGAIGEMARVRVNGRDLGVAWFPPYRVALPTDLRATGNALEVVVANTWWNRLLADLRLPAQQRLIRTNISIKPDGQPLPSGLLGPVRILAPGS